MADSSANMPGASPGARIHDGVGTFSRASRCVVYRAGLAGRPRTLATRSRSADGPWVESHTVRLPSGSQAAIAACGSIGLLCVVAVVYVWSTVTSARASPAATSPWLVVVGNAGLTFAGV